MGRRSLLILLMLFLAAPALAGQPKIYVSEEDTTESLRLGALATAIGAGNGWMRPVRDDGTTTDVYRDPCGSCVLIENGIRGAWVLTAKRVVQNTSHLPYADLRFCFLADTTTAFPSGTNGFVPELVVADAPAGVHIHPSRDLALVQLDALVKDAHGELIAPMPFYTGPLNAGQIVMIGGYGMTGGEDGAFLGGAFDGKRHCARMQYGFKFPNSLHQFVVLYSPEIPVGGTMGMGDSGGMAAIEIGQELQLAGILINGGTDNTIFEYLQDAPEVFTWIDDLIEAELTHSGAKAEWESYQ